MIRPTCDKCSNELNDYGGILLSPPNEQGMVYKFHLCKKCYEKVCYFIVIDEAKLSV